MRNYRTDYRLWLVLFWPALILVGFVYGFAGDGVHSLWGGIWAWVNRGRVTADEAGMVVMQALCGVPLAFVLAWAGQAAAQVFGVRLMPRRKPTQATDYDDAPPPPSG